MGRITGQDTPMSLEELLAKEGFTEKKPNMFRRAFSQSQPASMPNIPYRDQRKSITSHKKTNRVKSDIPRSGSTAKLPPNNRIKGGKSKGIHFRNETIDEGQSEESREKSKRVAKYLRDAQHLSVELSEDFVDDEKAEDTFESCETYKDIYSNEIFSHHTSEREMERGENINLLEKSYNRSRTLAQKQNVDDRVYEVEQNSPEPAIDEAAIRAVISILNGYIKRFLIDGDFRTSFRHNCFASLNFSELEEDLITQSKVLANLEQAIEVVERSAEESASERELKKASLQLSVITGLNSNKLKDGFTSGIPNSKLSAFAHLYLSVVCKLQKKDKIAARHLLHVFTDSPFLARTILLPELWEHMFLPHLVHLKEWYNQEVESLGDNTPRTGRKLKLLEKVYNEIIDSGTYQFAIYYKNWLSNEFEAPSTPSINVPFSPFEGLKQVSSSYSGKAFYREDSSSDSFGDPVGSLSPHPMVSKKLYDTMFGRSSKPEVDDVEGFNKSGKLSNNVTSSGNSIFEEKQALPCSSTAATRMEQFDERRDASHQEEKIVANDVRKVHQDSLLVPVQGQEGEIFGKSPPSMVNAVANELMLKRLAKSVSAQPDTEGFLKIVAASILPHTTDKEPYPNTNVNLVRMKSIAEESDANNSIPKDFVCPLTGLVFEEPATLETGHTFEREAIREWLNQGNRKCPVSEKTLECRSVPLTNFILKRIVDNWKSEKSL